MSSVTLRVKPLANSNFSLFLDIYAGKQRYKEYLKLYVSKDYTKPENKNILKQDRDSWQLAQTIHAKRLLYVKEEAFGFTPQNSNQDFITYYKKQALLKSHSTYENALSHILIYNKRETLSFSHIDENYIRGLITYLKNEELKLSTTSIRIYLLRISIILNLAVKDKIITVNPFNFLKRGKGGEIPAKKQKKIEYLTLAELQTLEKTPFRREEIKEYFLFACFTGLRESDLRKMKWQDIHEGNLTYTQKKQGDSIIHYLPLSKQALNLLQLIKQRQLLSNFNGSEYTFSHICSHSVVTLNLKKLAKKAKIDKNIHMHVGRHTFATLALTHGVSLYTVSKMLGHSNISMTQIYGEIIDDVKQKASELIPML